MNYWHSYIHNSFGCEVDSIREFVQKKQTPISMEGGQFSSGKQRHIEHCACVLERWTDSRCLKLDCIRERKKVTSSVNEKQKSCGFSLSFVGHPQCRSTGLAEGVLWSVNKSLFPGPFFVSVFVSVCISICFLLLSYPLAHFLHTHPIWLGSRALQLSLSCHATWKAVKELPNSAHSGFHLESLFDKNLGSSALLSAQLLCPYRSE